MSKSKSKKATVPPQVAMEFEMVPIGDLNPWPGNSRRGNVKLIKESILKNGFISPLIVQKSSMQVCAGNHRLLAAQKLKMKTVPCIVTELTEAEAERYLMVDNKAGDEATYDEKAHAAMLSKLLSEDPDSEAALAGTGYSTSEAEEIITTAAWHDFEPGETEGAEEAPAASDATVKKASMEERRSAVAALATRSFVIKYSLEDYAEIQDGLERVMADVRVETLSEALAHLLVQAGYSQEIPAGLRKDEDEEG